MSSECNRLLVANRGEIARRVFTTAATMGIETVAVHARADRDAPFVTDADTAVDLGPGPAADTYLNSGAILAAAAATGADAIHPGYGFLSENAAFARAVTAAGLTWIGPPPDAIVAMGDKLAAKTLMTANGVPTLPSVPVTPDADPDHLTGLAAQIGYPVLVKAAAGGGGKGMRVVTDPAGLPAAVAGAQREAAASFGDPTVFLERYLTTPRHVEIQVLGDRHGTLVHCYERECSIQRRHQKIIEEAPSPAVTPALRHTMGAAALHAARAIAYHSVGTVEFLLDGTGDNAPFYFLEVNTRLQVEHPVTEAVTGLDLVREQIRVARGEPLGYTQDDLTLTGHAIEARIYAEDPTAGFLPATGTLTAFEPPTEPAARYDSGVTTGTTIGVAYDPLLAKVIVHAPTRTEAAARLALALDRTVIAGVTTNRAFLVDTLRHPDFTAGNTTTDFIERTGIAATTDPAPVPADLVAAAVLHRQAANRAAAGVLTFLRPAHRNSTMPPETVAFTTPGAVTVTAAYRTDRDGTTTLTVTDDAGSEPRHLTARPLGLDDTTLRADIDGVQATYRIIGSGPTRHVQGPRTRTDLTEQPRFGDPTTHAVAGAQVAPMPGTVRVLDVAPGDTVTAGQTLVVLEAMKMEHTVTAPGPGRVTEVRCAVGDQIDTGDVLVVVEATDT